MGIPVTRFEGVPFDDRRNPVKKGRAEDAGDWNFDNGVEEPCTEVWSEEDKQLRREEREDEENEDWFSSSIKIDHCCVGCIMTTCLKSLGGQIIDMFTPVDPMTKEKVIAAYLAGHGRNQITRELCSYAATG